MSAIDNSEVTQTQKQAEDNLLLNFATISKPSGETCRKSKKVLYFSDGTLEESESDSEVDGEEDTKSEPPVDTATMSWPAWILHQGSKGGVNTLNYLDYMGETLAYYLGITSSKYQYEIDEYYRTKKEEEARANKIEMEAASWASTSRKENVVPSPVVSEIISKNTETV